MWSHWWSLFSKAIWSIYLRTLAAKILLSDWHMEYDSSHWLLNQGPRKGCLVATTTPQPHWIHILWIRIVWIPVAHEVWSSTENISCCHILKELWVEQGKSSKASANFEGQNAMLEWRVPTSMKQPADELIFCKQRDKMRWSYRNRHEGPPKVTTIQFPKNSSWQKTGIVAHQSEKHFHLFGLAYFLHTD